MTAEVAILNKQAVALAADSAVTNSGPHGQKIFNTVNKLFALSKYHPIGIMVYSSAEVMGVPTETAIKVFREKVLGDEPLAKLENYSDLFVKFLKEDQTLFSDDARMAHCGQMIRLYVSGLYDDIMRELVEEFPGWGEPTQDQATQKARELLQEERERFRTSKSLPGVTPALRKTLRVGLRNVINEGNSFFKQKFALGNSDVRLLTETCLDLFLKEAKSGSETGVVIAGFGEAEHFPQLRRFEFESSVQNAHKLRHGPSSGINNDTTAAIVPFAQTEMIETFVQGRASTFDQFLRGFIDDYFEKEKQKATNNATPQTDVSVIHGLLDEMNRDLRKQFMESVQRFTKYAHVQPVLGTVSALPKEELAIMAEALINLTAIKRRMSPDAETVGGPTDVAIISKGDGFVWIKRKHYFKGELNPGFVHNYFREEKTA